MRYALCALRALNRSYLLPHEDGVTDSKTEKGNGHDGNQIGGDDEKALGNRKRALESRDRQSLHGSHQDQRSCGLTHWIEYRRSGITIKGHRRKGGDNPLYLFLSDNHLGICPCTLIDRGDHIRQNSGPKAYEEGEKDPQS